MVISKNNGTYTFKLDGKTLYTTSRVTILYGMNVNGTCILLAHGTVDKMYIESERRKGIMSSRGLNRDAVQTLELPEDISLSELYSLLHVPGMVTGYVNSLHEDLRVS